MEYFYLTAPENHCDLADCFGGVFDPEKKIWMFDIERKQEVLNFLSCCKDETDEEDINDYLNTHTKPKRSRSIHRARSACADKSSDSESDSNSNSNSDSESEYEYQESSDPKKHPKENMCDIEEKVQMTRQKKIQELKKFIK